MIVFLLRSLCPCQRSLITNVPHGCCLQQECVLSLLLFIDVNGIDSHSRVDENVTVESFRINRLLFADDLVLLASSEQGPQHVADRFSVMSDQAGMKISTKQTEVLCLSRNPSQCSLQVSSKTLQQAEKLSTWGGIHE